MPRYKLTDLDVAGVRFASREGASLATIANIYFVSRTQVWRIINNLQRKTDSSLRSKSGGDLLPMAEAPVPSTKTEDKVLLEFLKKR